VGKKPKLKISRGEGPEVKGVLSPKKRIVLEGFRNSTPFWEREDAAKGVQG